MKILRCENEDSIYFVEIGRVWNTKDASYLSNKISFIEGKIIVEFDVEFSMNTIWYSKNTKTSDATREDIVKEVLK